MNVKKIILLVEDDPSLSQAVKMKLEKNDFSVVPCSTVESALGAIKNNEGIVAVWLDHYLLGKENGLDFVIKLKESNDTAKDLPIFVVSNTASPDKVKSYIRLGVNKYYVKAENRLEDIISDIKKFVD